MSHLNAQKAQDINASNTRRARDPVRRDTYDINDPHVRQPRTLGNGKPFDHFDTAQSIIAAAKAQQAASVANGPKGYQGDLGHIGVRLLELMLEKRDYDTSTNDAAIAQYASDLGGFVA